MQIDSEAAQPLSKRQLAKLAAGALLAATVVLLLFVLPAEYGRDPTGFGRVSGLMRLGAPKNGISRSGTSKSGTLKIDTSAGDTAKSGTAEGGTARSAALETPAQNAFARYYQSPYRSDVIDIPVAAAGAAGGGDELEYKVRLQTGESLIYSWSLQGDVPAEEFYFDFHGETPVSTEHPQATVLEYKQATGLGSNGVLIAPIDGVHGWYFQNQSEKPVVVHLQISGFYTLVAPGDYGNERGILPVRPPEPAGSRQAHAPT